MNEKHPFTTVSLNLAYSPPAQETWESIAGPYIPDGIPKEDKEAPTTQYAPALMGLLGVLREIVDAIQKDPVFEITMDKSNVNYGNHALTTFVVTFPDGRHLDLVWETPTTEEKYDGVEL